MGMANNDPNWRVVAGEDIDANEVVYIKSDGLAWLAQANSATTLAVGICPQTLKTGQRVPVIRQGTLSEVGGLAGTAGAPVYLSPATAGAMTLTAPASPNKVQRLGIIRYEDTTTMLIDIVDRAVAPTGA